MAKGKPRRIKIPKQSKTKRKAHDARFGIDESLYHRAGPEKIALELEKAGARIEEQGEGLFLVYPAKGVPLCHSYGEAVVVRRPWDGMVTQGKQDKNRVEFYCGTCHVARRAWEAIDDIIGWGR